MNGTISATLNVEELIQRLLKELQIAQAAAQVANNQVLRLQAQIDLLTQLKTDAIAINQEANGVVDIPA